ncbi:hypothetical protein B6N60_01728 [Richelia sinica FACHB-800]|uniref:Uncharacterized protein n=1 Tax=Richelia sinica FACHB-800 TaxID=1357546 RepID=A0A975Y4C5_9NOST|nr:hypothetical protein B6N60_01728 [Richelia sinica FACHB-800]
MSVVLKLKNLSNTGNLASKNRFLHLYFDVLLEFWQDILVDRCKTLMEGYRRS